MTEWIVVVPVKGTDLSKTRLAALPADVAERRQLALAFALDTVEALRAAAGVVEILVVTNDRDSVDALTALGATTLADPGGGLNAALEAGIAEARRRRPTAAVAAITADLPALTPQAVETALTLAASHPVSFVADAAGTGTTTIAALPDVDLVPHFGVGSALAHAASGMIALPVPADSPLRRDVDTPADVAGGAASFGPHTRAALARAAPARGAPARDDLSK